MRSQPDAQRRGAHAPKVSMEILESGAAPVERVRAGGLPSASWPIGFLIGLGVLVASAVSWPANDTGQPVEVVVAVSGDHESGLPSARPRPIESSATLVLLLPEADQVVLGTLVPIAGRFMPPKRRPGSTGAMSVRVVITDDDRTLGAALMPIANGLFLGSVCVVAPPKGKRVRISVTTTIDPERELASVSIVLAASAPGVRPTTCDTD